MIEVHHDPIEIEKKRGPCYVAPIKAVIDRGRWCWVITQKQHDNTWLEVASFACQPEEETSAEEILAIVSKSIREYSKEISNSG